MTGCLSYLLVFVLETKANDGKEGWAVNCLPFALRHRHSHFQAGKLCSVSGIRGLEDTAYGICRRKEAR